MTLKPGTMLGPYEIRELIGKGGMGEVYRAYDSKLKRDVALKALPEQFARDPDRVARFRREAQLLASLNHTNIAAVYGLEESGETPCLVMEYVPGETLRDMVGELGVGSGGSGGGVPIEEALSIGKQMAEALEHAHEKAIIHRDLKPANVKLTPQGQVKVLDFGLAKAFAGDSAEVSESQAPTVLTASPTIPGTILGTAAYMSPEQAKGKTVDKRTDIWAFGCVLYELLTGKQAFGGEDVSETLASVLKAEPDWAALPEGTPHGIRVLLRRCMQKDAKRRFRDAADLYIQIEEAQAATPAPPPTATAVSQAPAWKRALPWAVAGSAVLVAASALAMLLLRRGPVEASVVRFSIPTAITSSSARMAISPDGQHVAYTGRSEGGGAEQIWIHSLESASAKALPGTEGSTNTFWSPDGHFLAFFAGGKVKKVDTRGGPPQTLCDLAIPRGGTWGANGTILFGSDTGGISRISASGGQPVPVTTLDSSREEITHGYPQLLPDGRHFLYLARSTNQEYSGIYVGSLDSDERNLVLSTEMKAAYVTPGYLLFMREETLMAQPFDTERWELTDEPVQVALDLSVNTANGAAGFSVSETGVLVYRTGDRTATQAQLIWVDRRGGKSEPLGPIGPYEDPELSPDGTRVVYSRPEFQGGFDVWLLELARGTLSRFTFAPRSDLYAIWSPDATRIVFGSNREGLANLYQKASSGAGSEELLLKPTGRGPVPTDWSSDGRYILYQIRRPGTSEDLWVAPLFGEEKPFAFLQSEFNELQGQLSPDGRFVAYASNESGRYEVYIQSFPSPTGKWQVSTAGGGEPRWRGDGKELFYIAADRKMMAVPVSAAATLELGTPQALFESPSYLAGTVLPNWRQQYDVTADAQRFLMNVLVADAPIPPIHVVLNWTASLKK